MIKKKQLSILIPQYRTLYLTKLCLRSIKKYTDLNKVKVIVIDNESNDESIEYLRTLKWITLIERKAVEGEPPPQAHVGAMALGMENVTTPYVLSIHTDTIVKSDKWLAFLIDKIEEDENIAGVGSWKLEFTPPLKRFLKALERFWQLKIWYPIIGKKSGNIVGHGNNHYFLRSHCALFKTDLVKKYTDGFGDSGECAGKGMSRKLLDQGYDLTFITPHELVKYLEHFNHATMILNPNISGRKTGKKSVYKKLKKELFSAKYQNILNNSSLDD